MMELVVSSDTHGTKACAQTVHGERQQGPTSICLFLDRLVKTRHHVQSMRYPIAISAGLLSGLCTSALRLRPFTGGACSEEGQLCVTKVRVG